MTTISIRVENGVEKPSISYYKTGPLTISGSNTGNSTIGLNSIQNQFTSYTLSSQGDSIGDTYISGTTITEGGLYGKVVSGGFRSVISQGNIVSLPMSSPTLYTSISYGDLGDNYGFMAIGYFIPPTTGTYTFYTSSDDGSGVWIGDIAAASSGRTTANAIVNNDMGSGHGNQERSGSTTLTAGTAYPIRIVHEEGGGGSNLTFSWAGPSITKTTDLTSYFWYTGNADFGNVGIIGPQTTVTTSALSTSFPQDIRTYNRDRTTIVSNKPVRSTRILANSIRASINVTGQVNTKLSDGSVVSGGGGGVGSDSAVASTIKQIWY